MRMKKLVNTLMVGCALGGITLAPVSSAFAQSKAQSQRRQTMKNQWRNLAIGAGALGILGLLKNDKTLFFAGTAGALYSAYRYEQDRKSQSKIDRARASYFGRSSFTRDGKRYVRRTVYKNGKKYYRFVRA